MTCAVLPLLSQLTDRSLRVSQAHVMRLAYTTRHGRGRRLPHRCRDVPQRHRVDVAECSAHLGPRCLRIPAAALDRHVDALAFLAGNRLSCAHHCTIRGRFRMVTLKRATGHKRPPPPPPPPPPPERRPVLRLFERCKDKIFQMDAATRTEQHRAQNLYDFVLSFDKRLSEKSHLAFWTIGVAWKQFRQVR